MTLEEFAAKLLEFRAAITTKLAAIATEPEEDPKWGSSDERVELIHELQELVVQVESLIETLEEEPEDSEEAGRRAKPRLRQSLLANSSSTSSAGLSTAGACGHAESAAALELPV